MCIRDRIKAQVDDATSDFDREKLQERLAKLAGGVAVIKVGAATEVELKEKKARVEDALSATRAAVDEGIVVGGGVALVRAQKALEALAAKTKNDDEKSGILLLAEALEALSPHADTRRRLRPTRLGRSRFRRKTVP
mgnify:CR=1 FL=1